MTHIINPYRFGGSTIIPSDVANLLFWLNPAEASSVLNSTSPDVAATDGQTIASVQDQSGNGNHFTQATSSLRPILDIDGMNGTRGVSYDNTDDALSGGSQTSLVTLFFAIETADTKYIVFHNNSGNSNYLISADSGSTVAAVSNNAGSPAFRVNGASVTWVNRGDVYTSLSAGPSVVTIENISIGWSDFKIGGFVDFGFPLGGVIGDVVGYSSAVSTAERAGIEQYIASQHGISF